MTELRDRLVQSEIDRNLAITEGVKAEARYHDEQAENWRLDNVERKSTDDSAHVYNFMDEVGGTSARKCIEALSAWSRREPGCSMTVVFNSPGGSVTAGLALYDHIVALRTQGHNIRTVAMGMAASMAGVLLQAGDERLIGRGAYLLIHEIASVTAGKMGDLEDEMVLLKKMQARIVSILAERSKLTVEEIKRRWKRRDWWLDSDEAVSLGFADKIL